MHLERERSPLGTSPAMFGAGLHLVEAVSYSLAQQLQHCNGQDLR